MLNPVFADEKIRGRGAPSAAWTWAVLKGASAVEIGEAGEP